MSHLTGVLCNPRGTVEELVSGVFKLPIEISFNTTTTRARYTASKRTTVMKQMREPFGDIIHPKHAESSGFDALKLLKEIEELKIENEKLNVTSPITRTYELIKQPSNWRLDVILLLVILVYIGYKSYGCWSKIRQPNSDVPPPLPPRDRQP